MDTKHGLDYLEDAIKKYTGIENLHVVGIKSFHKTLAFGQQKEAGFMDDGDVNPEIALYVNGDSALLGIKTPNISDRTVDWWITNRLKPYQERRAS